MLDLFGRKKQENIMKEYIREVIRIGAASISDSIAGAIYSKASNYEHNVIPLLIYLNQLQQYMLSFKRTRIHLTNDIGIICNKIGVTGFIDLKNEALYWPQIEPTNQEESIGKFKTCLLEHGQKEINLNSSLKIIEAIQNLQRSLPAGRHIIKNTVFGDYNLQVKNNITISLNGGHLFISKDANEIGPHSHYDVRYEI